jgi:hypothetical protein
MAAKRFPGRSGLFRPRQQDDEVVPVDSPKKAARLFIEQVTIDFVAADETDPMLPMRAFDAQTGTLLLQVGDLLTIFEAGFQPTLAVQRMPDEIRRDSAGNRVQHEGDGDSAKAGADDHSARMERFA